VKESYTGQYLKPVLGRSKSAPGSTKESRDTQQKSESSGANKKLKKQAAE